MAVENPAAGKQAPRLPAWKRLGLKLKNAKEIPNEAYGVSEKPTKPSANQQPTPTKQQLDSPATARLTQDAGITPKKTKRSRDEESSSDGRKKAKLGVSEENDASTPIKKSVTTSAAAPAPLMSASWLTGDNTQRNEKSGSESPGKRRKSVAFTEDTKTEDGNSAQTLFQNWFAAESGAAEQAESEAPAVVETANATSDSPKPTKEKKAKKSKPEKSQLSEGSKDKQAKVRKEKSTDKPTPIYVQYLQQYHTDKASWKFNKSKQNDLIKNLWNVYRITPEHDEALGEYISGLQGEAARQRIKEASEATLKKELEKLLGECKKAATKLSEEFQTPEMEDPAKRLAAAESSLKKYLETLHTTGALSDSAFDEEVENARTAKARGDRAELILRVAFGLDTAEALRPVPLTARAKKRSKKSRTAADSSDDSSSDSDDDEGSSAKKPKTAPKSILKKPAKEDESSSSENDSSSDSSSDDSSDEDSDSSDSDSSSESESDSDDGSSSESDKDSSKKKAKKETKKEAKKEQAPARSEREWTPPKKAVPFDKALLDQIYNSKKQMLYRR